MRRTDRATGSITPLLDRRTGLVRYRVRVTVGGKRTGFGIYDTEADAIRVRDEALAEISGRPRGLSLLSWGARWFARRERDGLHRDVEGSRSVWRTHIETAPFACGPMRAIKRTDVVAWVKGILVRRARQTVLNAFNLLHRCLGDAADEGLIPSNPATGVKVPKRPREDEPWTWLRRAEIDALLAMDLRPDQRAIFAVAAYTGLRPGEIFGLRWSDVGGELAVRRSYNGPTKGGRVRRVPLLAPAREALRAWRRAKPGVASALVFPGEPTPRYPDYKGCHAKGYDAGFADMIGKVVTDRAVRFYDLRHTCASHLIQGTLVPGLAALRLEDVQLWLGHASRTTTERYAHLCPDRLHGLVARSGEDGARVRAEVSVTNWSEGISLRAKS